MSLSPEHNHEVATKNKIQVHQKKERAQIVIIIIINIIAMAVVHGKREAFAL